MSDREEEKSGDRRGSVPHPFVGFAVGLRLLLGVLLPADVAAQFPSGNVISLDRDRAVFRTAMLDQIRPVMEAWQEAWHPGTGLSVDSSYTSDAVVAIRGSVMTGSRTLADFARTVRPGVARLGSSMLDFDASETLAYVYGGWNATAVQGGVRESGRLVTILRKSGEDWAIRSQLFGTDSTSQHVFRAVDQLEPLPSMEHRVVAGSPTASASMWDDQGGRAARSQSRILAYRALVALLDSVRAAWQDDDIEALQALMRPDAWIQLPGVEGWAGPAASTDLRAALRGLGTLYTVELDFDYGGTLAFLSGRYHAERTAGSPLSGSYMAVFQNLGSRWLVRSLTFF